MAMIDHVGHEPGDATRFAALEFHPQSLPTALNADDFRQEGLVEFVYEGIDVLVFCVSPGWHIGRFINGFLGANPVSFKINRD